MARAAKGHQWPMNAHDQSAATSWKSSTKLDTAIYVSICLYYEFYAILCLWITIFQLLINHVDLIHSYAKLTFTNRVRCVQLPLGATLGEHSCWDHILPQMRLSKGKSRWALCTSDSGHDVRNATCMTSCIGNITLAPLCEHQLVHAASDPDQDLWFPTCHPTFGVADVSEGDQTGNLIRVRVIVVNGRSIVTNHSQLTSIE